MMRKSIVLAAFIIILGFFLNGCESPTGGTTNQTYVNISGVTNYYGKYGQFALYNTTGNLVAITNMTSISQSGILNSGLYEYPNNYIPWFGTGSFIALFAVSSTNPGSDILYTGIMESVSVSSNSIELNLNDFTSVNLNNNTFAKEGDSMVFHSESAGSSSAYSMQAGNIITGTGSIKVLVRATTPNNHEEFGIEYGRRGAGTSKIVNFYINADGEYCIYWFDGSNSSSSISWKSSSAIKKTLNEWNELRIDYNTTTRVFSFYINGTKVLDKNFSSIDEGYIIYYTSLRYSNVSRENPYRLEFKTISPQIYP